MIVADDGESQNRHTMIFERIDFRSRYPETLVHSLLDTANHLSFVFQTP